jgi:hypothetical protein
MYVRVLSCQSAPLINQKKINRIRTYCKSSSSNYVRTLRRNGGGIYWRWFRARGRRPGCWVLAAEKITAQKIYKRSLSTRDDWLTSDCMHTRARPVELIKGGKLDKAKHGEALGVETRTWKVEEIAQITYFCCPSWIKYLFFSIFCKKYQFLHVICCTEVQI